MPVPPPPASGPGIRRARLEARDGLRDWFAEWCGRRGVTVRDLGDILEVSHAVAHAKLRGEKPLTLNDVYRFPPRFRNELILEFSSWCAAHNDHRSHA